MNSRISFLLSFSALLLFMGLSFNACTNKSQAEVELNSPNSLSATAGERSGETIQIGVVEDGRFSFTVSQDQLAAVYSYNVESNLDESGELTEARVDIPSNEEEGETSYVVLTGSLGDEGSASMSMEVTLDEIESGFLVMVSVRPVYAGLCYRSGCGSCEQLPIYPNQQCRCLPAGPFCDYYPDPTILWIW